MRSKIRLSLLLSLVFHVVLVLGLFSRADHDGREAESLVVELVSLGRIESVPLRTGDSTGGSDLLPPQPAFPMGSDETFDSIEEEAQPPEPFFDPDAEAQSPPAFDQEEQEISFPEESDRSFDPDPPPMEDVEESLLEERTETEPAFRLVAGIDRSKKESTGPTVAKGTGHGSPGDGAPQPTVGDALSGGGAAGAGGGQSGPRFVIPSAGRSNPKPRYPERARAEGREGTALLKVMVLSTGKVGEALIEQSSGHADLDRSAVEAVMKWTFLPARRGEHPVVSSVRIPVTFALDRP
ncbi:MAG: TonB family protein [Candidatus Manganitrophus sp. SA1]|nr:TonB family protein [Candidatus Manganitrophus morganii]